MPPAPARGRARAHRLSLRLSENTWEPPRAGRQGRTLRTQSDPKGARAPTAGLLPGDPARGRLARPPGRPELLLCPCVQQNKALLTSVAAKFLKCPYLSSLRCQDRVATLTGLLPRARALCHSAHTAGDIQPHGHSGGLPASASQGGDRVHSGQVTSHTGAHDATMQPLQTSPVPLTRKAGPGPNDLPQHGAFLRRVPAPTPRAESPRAAEDNRGKFIRSAHFIFL